MRSGHGAQNSDEISGRSCMIPWPSIMMTMVHLEYQSPSWWQCRGGCSGKLCEEVRNWKRQGPFFGGIPWAGLAVGWQDRARSAAGAAGALEPAWAASNSCGCALPAAFQNVILQRLHFLSWSTTCSGNVHSLNGQIHIIRNFRQKKMSPFCIQLPFQ